MRDLLKYYVHIEMALQITKYCTMYKNLLQLKLKSCHVVNWDISLTLISPGL